MEINKRGSDLNKYKTRKTQKLNPEPLNRSYDKINECLKVYGFYGLLNLDPTIKFKNSRVFIQAINWSFFWAQTPYVSIS